MDLLKKTILGFVLLLLVSFVHADLDSDLDACGDNIRCAYKVAAKHGDENACSTLKEGLVDGCEDFVERQIPENPEVVVNSPFTVNEDGITKLSEKSEKQFGTFPFSFSVVLVLVFFFVIFVLFEKHRHDLFLDDNVELINYVKKSLNLGKDENKIKEKLSRVGWKARDIEKVFKEIKK